MASSGLWFRMQDVKSKSSISLTKIQKKFPVASRVVDQFYFLSLASKQAREGGGRRMKQHSWVISQYQ